MKPLITVLVSIVLCVACHKQAETSIKNNGAFMKSKGEDHVLLDQIIDSGELIVTTLTGPDTYFDYQGVRLGIQYALVENFAATLGVGIRIELAADTTEMIQNLKSGNVDIIAFQIPTDLCKAHSLCCAGVHDTLAQTSWAIRTNENELCKELNSWYSQDIEVVIKKVQTKQIHDRHEIKRTVKAPYISRKKGIISIYDNHFKRAAQRLDWDWKLIAALCYQESGFDSNAVSYMGAKGLMQIMPSTAHHLNLSEQNIFKPSENIEAAGRYLDELKSIFSHIRNNEEQIKFILAAYNAGPGHIYDAQALTRKYGKNPNYWNDVSYYVLKLNEPLYYRDSIVKYGYMIGSETFNYVNDILKRWHMYGGNVSNVENPKYKVFELNATSDKHPKRKPNKYSKEQKILSVDELKKQK